MDEENMPVMTEKKPGVFVTLLKVIGYIFSYTIPKDFSLIIFALFILFQTRPMFPGEEWDKLWADREVMSRFMGMILTRSLWLKWYYIGSALISLLILFLVFRIRKQPFRERTKLKSCEPFFFLTALVYGIGAFLLFTGIGEVFPRVSMGPADTTVFYDWFMLNPYDFPQVLIQFLTAGLISPLLEEIIFRGICLDHLKKIWPFPAAVIIISVIFGILHFAMPDMLLLALWSIPLCLLVHKSGSVLPGMVAHMVYNSLVILYRVLSLSQKVKGMPYLLLCFLFGTLLLIISAWLYQMTLKKNAGKKETP